MSTILAGTDDLKTSKRSVLFRSVLAPAAVVFMSWTFPRIAVFKISEILALLASHRVMFSKQSITPILRCYWLFILATVTSLATCLFTIGKGSMTLTSEKGLYSSPELVPFATLLHFVVYFFAIVAVTNYFLSSSENDISKTLKWTYYVTLLPGILQMLRIYSGVHFNLPWFERPDVGPFSGVFDAGYLRIMGFEFEPLAYGGTIVVACCLSMHNGRRIPWLGLIVLAHTFGTGAIVGAILAFVITMSKRLTKYIVPLYAMGFLAISIFIYVNIKPLISLASLSGSIAERLGADYACIAMWLDHPLGVGLGLYGYFFNKYDPGNGTFAAGSLDYYPNNDPGMFLAYGGPIFLIAYLYTFFFVLRSSRSRWLSVAAIALLFQAFSAYLYFDPAIIVVFSMLLAKSEPIARRLK